MRTPLELVAEKRKRLKMKLKEKKKKEDSKSSELNAFSLDWFQQLISVNQTDIIIRFLKLW